MKKDDREESHSPPRRAIEAPHMTRVYHLIYYSSSLLPPLGDGGRRQIDNILNVAMEMNARNEVTGALAFNELYFAQVLEGPFEAVKATYANILKDRRHTNVTVLQEGWIEARDFARWAMAFVDDEASIQVISGPLRLEEILSKERPKAALALLEMMNFWLLRSA
jgi:hypothetical protein